MNISKISLFALLVLFACLAFADLRQIELSGKVPTWDEEKVPEKVPLQIKSLAIDIKVHDTLATTRMQFAIYNPSEDEEAEADIVLPLPPFSTVTGYALDIEGQMVDGVYVEKELARFTYDDIVSQMIDPGILEARDENTFSINIYPVPGKGGRVFSVEFITELAENSYELPLQYKGKVEEASLSIEIDGVERKPGIKYPRSMASKLHGRDNGFSVKNQWEDISLNGILRIASDRPKADHLLVEKSQNGDYYFVIEDTLGQAAPAAGDNGNVVPDHITVYWDASISRLHSNIPAEIKLLERFLDHVDAEHLVLDLIVFRNRAEVVKTFDLEDSPNSLLEYLQSLQYDGASNLTDVLTFKLHDGNDYCLLFTDGGFNYGSRNVDSLRCRTYIISSSGQAKDGYLEHLALQSGGDYFSLRAQNPKDIVERIGGAPLRLISSVSDNGVVEEISTNTIRPVNNKLQITGRLVSVEARLTLNYGYGDNIIHSEVFELKQHNALNSESARLLWARNKINQMLRNVQPDREAVIAASRRHGVISPFTSLLVLEDPEQYAEYKIEPPATMPKWVEEYNEYIAEYSHDSEAHFNKVLKRWEELVKWWKTDFPSKPEKKAKPVSAGRSQVPRAGEIVDSIQAEDVGRMPDRNLAESVQRVSGVEVPGESAMLEEIQVSGIRGSIEESTGPTISVKPWSPDRVYLAELGKVKKDLYFAKYIELRKEHGQLPAYYIEVADFLIGEGQQDLALQVLSNLTELDTSDYTIRRILGYKLTEYGELDLAIEVLESVLEENRNEPQSFRDLALVYVQRADRLLEKGKDKLATEAAKQDYSRALDLLYKVVLEPWDERFEGIESISLVEINRVVAKCKTLGINEFNIDKRLIKLLDVDFRVVAAWHADRVDIDLWMVEPTEEIAIYNNPLTGIGGHMSSDMTDGFGPEEYMLKKAVKGKYAVKVHYYGSNGINPTGAVKLKVDVYTDYGRKNEKQEVLTLELEEREDQYLVGEIEF